MSLDSLSGSLHLNSALAGVQDMVVAFLPIIGNHYFGRIPNQFFWLSVITISSFMGLFFTNGVILTGMRWIGKIASSGMFSQIYIHTETVVIRSSEPFRLEKNKKS